MTREEAREEARETLLCLYDAVDEEGVIDTHTWYKGIQDNIRESLSMAIKALEQEPKEITLEDVKEYCKPRLLTIITNELYYELTHPTIKALEQEPCEDAISRQAVLDINFKRIILTTAKPAEMIEQKIKVLPSVNPQEPKWIPVSERLPEKNMPCLVSAGKLLLTQIALYSDLMGTIDHKIFYQGDYGHENFVDITEYVKAWMPLPEPYKAESEE